jgi:hypothetical protein
MAQDKLKRSRKLEDVPLEKAVETPLIDAGPTKFKDGEQGTDPQLERLIRDNRRILSELQRHDKVLKDYEIGDIQLPIKRFVMQDENANPVVLKAKSDGTITIVPYEEDVNYG